eukprot:5100339-Amphidinium_carterae.1
MAWNVNSFEQRVGEIAEKAERLELDAFFISETHATATSTLKVAGFTLVARYDRKRVKAGGAAFYVRSHAALQYDLLPQWCTEGIHVLCVRVWKSGAPFTLAGAYYVPVSSDVAPSQDDLLLATKHAFKHCDVLAGDLNMSIGINDFQGPIDVRGDYLCEHLLEDLGVDPLDFQGYSRITTKYKSTPDHAFELQDASLEVDIHLDEQGSSDHLPLILDLNGVGTQHTTHSPSRWCLDKADWELFSTLVDGYLAQHDLRRLTPVKQWETYQRSLFKAARKAIPYGKQRRNGRAWWSPALTALQTKLRAQHSL